MPSGPPITFHDQAGELTIPVEVFGVGDDSNKPPKEGDTTQRGSEDGVRVDASVAGTSKDGGLAAGADLDGGSDGEADAEVVSDDGGMLVMVDGGRDPQSILGAAAGVSAGPNNVTLLVNFAALRGHAEANNIDLIIGGIPQWKEFMSNSQGAALLDPVRDVDWVLIMGPSFADTQKDAVFVHYSVDDAVVDKIIGEVSKRYAKGGPVNLGVPGVKAWRAFADNGERIFLRPRPHIAVIVPSSHATEFARVLARTPVNPRVRPGEVLSLRALRPGGSISAIPQNVSEMRIWIVPRFTDSGADLYAEADCPTPAEATTAAESIKTLIGQKNTVMVRFATAGILSKVDITTTGSQVNLHMPGTRDQVDALLQLIAGFFLKVTLPPRNGATTAPAPTAAPSASASQ